MLVQMTMVFLPAKRATVKESARELRSYLVETCPLGWVPGPDGLAEEIGWDHHTTVAALGMLRRWGCIVESFRSGRCQRRLTGVR